MAKLQRYHQKVFGSTAEAEQISKFGSLQNGTPATYSGATVTPDLIQELDNYLSGWFGAIMANNSPTVEDFNAICYLFTYQVAYLLEKGIPEWCKDTTYYIGSVVSNSSGDLYRSIVDDNLNEDLTDLSKWKPYQIQVEVHTVDSGDTPYTLTSEDNKQIFLVDTSTSSIQFNLPAPSSEFSFTIKDKSGNALTNNIVLNRNGAEKIEGLAADYNCEANYGKWTVMSDGTDWYFI